MDLVKLTVPELEERFQLEYDKFKRIQLDAGHTLCEIWKRGSWKKRFADFGSYVNDVLGISKPTAYRLIGEVDKSVGQYKKQDTEPMLKQVKSVKSFNTSCDSEPKTKVSVESEEFKMPETEENQPEILIYKDREGRQIEGDMARMFMAADDQARDWTADLKALKDSMEAAAKDDPAWSAMNLSHLKKCVANIKELIKFSRPWAECPVCGGDGGIKGSCKTCKERVDVSGMSVDEVKEAQKGLKGRGWLIHNQWRTIPDDEK